MSFVSYLSRSGLLYPHQITRNGRLENHTRKRSYCLSKCIFFIPPLQSPLPLQALGQSKSVISVGGPTGLPSPSVSQPPWSPSRTMVHCTRIAAAAEKTNSSFSSPATCDQRGKKAGTADYFVARWTRQSLKVLLRPKLVIQTQSEIGEILWDTPRELMRESWGRKRER